MTDPIMPDRNNEGFLEDASQWTPEVAAIIAAGDKIVLSEKHWEIIEFLRLFYKEHEMSPPSNRLFVKSVKEAFGAKPLLIVCVFSLGVICNVANRRNFRHPFLKRRFNALFERKTDGRATLTTTAKSHDSNRSINDFNQ